MHTLPRRISKDDLVIMVLLAVLLIPIQDRLIQYGIVATGAIVVAILKGISRPVFISALTLSMIVVGIAILNDLDLYSAGKPLLFLFMLTALSGHFSSTHVLSQAAQSKMIFLFLGASLVIYAIPGFSALEFMYRNDPEGGTHSLRLSAPFRFPGDYGNLMVFFFAAGIDRSILYKLVIVGATLLTQSKLSLLAIGLIATRKKFLYAVLAALVLLFSFDQMLHFFENHLRHLYFALTDLERFIDTSKRFKEWRFVMENIGDLMISNEALAASNGLLEFESSILSYTVKIGIIPAFLLYCWLYYLLKKSGFNKFFYFVFIFSIFSAPLDREKLGFVLCILLPYFWNKKD